MGAQSRGREDRDIKEDLPRPGGADNLEADRWNSGWMELLLHTPAPTTLCIMDSPRPTVFSLQKTKLRLI